MTYICYPKCTTCQKAKAFLDERGVSYEARDIKLENPTAEELRGWWEKSGMPLKKFFNTSGQLYRGMGLSGKVITTPFTFASTTHAIVRKGLTPVFADIKPDDYTLDPAKIEELIDDETCAINMAFRSFEELKLSGGLLRVDGKPVAFTVGEEINPEVYLLHFEKALSGYEGLYAAINHEYAANHLENYRYINREEDLGIEGLRKAKLSYNPAILLEKYSATLLSETEEITELEQGD